MQQRRTVRYSVPIVSLILFIFSLNASAENQTLRIGHFPNLTHTTALVTHAKWRKSSKDIESQLGKDVTVNWFTYNAGPSAMEALLADSLDITYVGPNPAINAYVRSKGEDIRILAGSTFGGAALVVQGDDTIKSPDDFRGKRIGTPQLGNTQDIAARVWLIDRGIKVTQTGGDAQILPAENPDLLTLFSSKQLDAAWTVEPWVTRLEREGKGKIFLSENTALTTILVCSVKALKEKPELIKAFLKMHTETTAWINSNTDEAKALVSAELQAETSKPMLPEILNTAWPRMHFSAEITKSQLQQFLNSAKKVGFLKEVSDLSGMMHAF